MSDVTIRMEHVWKKFRKGELHDSLRDLIPALAARMLGRTSSQSARGEFWALQDISFEASRGEAFGIVGANGAGKSTMLKLISRIMKPTSGAVEVHGRLSALIEVSAGFHPDLTGRENIYLNGTILGMSRREIAAKFDQIVEFSGLSEFLDTPVKRYSSGMYARLGFSVAAHVNPDVMLVDEVLSVGDYLFQQKCMDRMRSVIQDGTTVLFVSHNLKAVTELCHRTMLLGHGKAVEIGPTDSVVRRYLSGILKPADEANKPVYISQVTVRDQDGEQSTFESGDTALVDIEFRAREAVENLAAEIWLTDEKEYEIFNTSSERLGCAPFSLAPGQTYRCTFELKLNIAHGVFHVCAGIFRHDIHKLYDSNAPAVTLFIGSTLAVQGAVNCFPRLVAAGTVAAATRDECRV
jgi:homopolymeric O-antigen transport system ATP-binding protein